MCFLEFLDIIPIAGSEWQYKQLLNSSLFINKSKHKILAPIDSDLFKPNNKLEAREKLGLPKGKKIIFFGAASLTSKRKGLKELIEALLGLKSQIQAGEGIDVFLAIAGRNNPQLGVNMPFDYKFLGYLNYKQLATAYQAADLFACPSIEDSGPMMINQSIMCGTPVVAFKMGIALDLVINNVTGYSVENRNSIEFASAIKKLLTLPTKELEIMKINCRKLGMERTSMSSIQKEWISLIANEL